MGFENFGQNIPENNDFDQKNEEQEKAREIGVSTSPDFRFLINLVNSHNDWKYSDGEVMDAKTLAETINEVRLGQKDINYVTRRYGLRTKVQELLKEQNSEVSGNESIEDQDESVESQEDLVKIYLNAHTKHSDLMKEFLSQVNARDRHVKESGHMPNIKEDVEEYNQKIKALSLEMDKEMHLMKTIFSQLTEETKEAYLKPPEASQVG